MRFINSKKITILLALFLSYGCASLPKSASGPVFSKVIVPSDKAVVYFFRSDRFMMSGRSIFMSIPLESDNCFQMVTAGYYPYVTDPGKLRIGYAFQTGIISAEGREYSINLQKGDVRYVKVDYSDDFAPVIEFTEIPSEKAISEIQAYRLIDKCD